MDGITWSSYGYPWMFGDASLNVVQPTNFWYYPRKTTRIGHPSQQGVFIDLDSYRRSNDQGEFQDKYDAWQHLPLGRHNGLTTHSYVDGHVENFTVASGEDFTLMDGDSVSVPSLTPQTGSVVITGALRSTDTTASYGTIQGQVSAQYFYRFAPGETLGEMLQTMSSYFTSSSDLDGAYITRDGKSWPVSLRDVMYGGSPDGDITLRNGDVLTVPFSNQIVTVNGAVNNPGTYAYVPGKDVSYYVNLAGGLTSSAKGLDRYKLFNSYGEKLDKDAVITAETTIEMEISTFERDLGITVSVVGLVATILGIVTSVIELSN